MANYDASIRVNTKVNTSQMQKLQIQIDKATEKASSLAKKYDELRNKKIPTENYTELEKKVDSAKAELQKLISEENKMVEAGLDIGSPWDNLIEKEADAQLRIEALQEEMQKLVDTGKAFSIGGSKEEVAAAGKSLSMAQAEVRALNTKKQELINKQYQSVKGFKKMEKSGTKAMKAIGSQTKKSSGFLSGFGTRLKGILLSLFIFSWITKGFNAMVAAMQSGFKNLSQYCNDYNAAMSGLKSQSEQTKNSLAVAFEPIMTRIIPYITQLLNYISMASEALARFQAAISGKSSYVRAKKQVIDYAKSVKAASSETKGALAAFDEINVLEKNKGAGGGSGALEGADAFETVEIDSEYLKKIEELQKKLKELRKEFEKGFQKGFKTEAVDELREKTESVKESVAEIFNNPKVQDSMNNFSRSSAEMLGTFAGSAASTGISFATGIVGGIDKYLSDPQNQKFVSDKLSSIFDNMSETNDTLAEFAEAIAEISTAFESESFQEIQELFTQIASVTILNGLDFLSGLLSDITNLFVQPIADNKEGLKALLEDVFELVNVITEPLKQFLDLITENSESYSDGAIHSFFEWFASSNSETLEASIVGIRAAVQFLTDKIAAFNEGVREAKEAISYNIGELKRSWTENFNKISEKFAPLKEKINDLREKTASVKDAIGTIVSNGMQYVETKIKSKLDSIKKHWSDKFDYLKTSAKEKFDLVKKEIRDAIEKIKSFFNFDWSLPHLKLPHFSISGSFSLNPPSAPSFGIDWYKNGGIMMHPTVFGINGNNLLAGGEPETGGEAILPLNSFYEKLDNILSSKLQSGTTGPIYMQLDGKTFAKLEMPYFKSEEQRIGVSFEAI